MIQNSEILQVEDLCAGQLVELKFSQTNLISREISTQVSKNHSNLVLCPLLGDPQINGGLGYSFGQPGTDPQPWKSLATHLLKKGIGWFLPTLITDSISNLERAFGQLESIRQEDQFLKTVCPGYHLEGPWISPEDGYRGAHQKSFVITPKWEDFESLQSSSGGNIRLVTIAPEIPGGISMIRRLVAAGVRVSLGHSQASSEQIRQAVDAGATLSTHLGNGIAKTISRHENPLWPQLAHPGLIPSIIPDGHHLPLDFVQTVIASKGLSKVIVTADSSPIAGLPSGIYPLWNTEVVMTPEGRVTIPGSGLLAGSGVFTDDCLRWMIDKGGMKLESALPLCGHQAAKALDITTINMETSKSFVLLKRNTKLSWDVKRVVFAKKVFWDNWEV